VTAPSGELSLITINPVSEVIRAVIFRQDADLAHAKLSDTTYDAKWFGHARLFSLEQVIAWCSACGWVLQDFRGIRMLADYIPEQDKGDEAEKLRDLLRLEHALAGMEPYRRMGRYLQFSFKKNP
jgi:hypothetical protein